MLIAEVSLLIELFTFMQFRFTITILANYKDYRIYRLEELKGRLKSNFLLYPTESYHKYIIYI